MCEPLSHSDAVEYYGYHKDTDVMIVEETR